MKNMKFVIGVVVYVACLLFSSGAVFAQTEEEVCAPKFRHNMFSICLVDALEGWACGNNGLIYHTEDGGMSWKIQPSGTMEALFSVSFINAKIGWVCGNKGIILHTRDGGKTWNKQKSPKEKILFIMKAISPDKAIAAGDWGTIVATTDGGKTWEDRTYPKDMMMYGIDFVNENEGWIAGEFGIVLHTTDGGVTWERQDTGVEGMLYSVSFKDNLNGLASGIDGLILKTSDGGVSWKAVQYMTEEEESAMEALKEIMAKGGRTEEGYIKERTQRRPLFEIKLLGDIALAGGDAGIFLLSDDAGETWHEVELPADMKLLWFRGISLTRKGDGIVGAAIGAKSVCVVTHDTDLYAIGYLPGLNVCEVK